jgi:hypothetical protein
MDFRKSRKSKSLLLCLLAATTWTPISAQLPTLVACADVTECRAQTEAAIAQGEYERAHDLAWRAVQQGTRNDAALMYLLARTQALSRRPDDALVMLRRLAELGVAPNASSGEFRDTRDLPGWPPVETLIERVKTRAPDVLPSRSRVSVTKPVEPVIPVAPVAPVRPVAPVAPALIENAGSFSSSDFAPGGIACDAASGRFILGDRPGRKLQILADGADHSIDLTRAGFLDVMALDINTTNGTLWVASAEADGRAATLHRVQLISGRALASYDVPEGLTPARPVDVAIAASGAVLLLDGAKGRVLVFRSDLAPIEVLTILQPGTPTSISVGSRDGIAFVAQREGLARIDLRTRAVVPLLGPGGTPLAGIERLRRYGTSLVGVQTIADGARRLVHLSLDPQGRLITALHVIDVPLPPGEAPIFTAVCGNTLALLLGEGDGGRATVWTVRRIRLGP